MTTIAFLGLGAMGSRMAQRLVDAGHDLVVWNRDASRTTAFAERGIRTANTPHEAAGDADIIFSMLRDDQASTDVWLDEENGALTAMTPEAIGIECSTLSPQHIAALASRFAARKQGFLATPLAGSRPQAEVGQLIFFAGGDASLLERALSVFKIMGAAVHHTGDAQSAAAVKLMVNALFGTQLAVMAELIGYARKANLNLQKALEAIRSTPVCSPTAGFAAEAMLKGNFAPAFPIDLVVKDFMLLEDSSGTIDSKTPVCQTTGRVYKSAADKGFAQDNITGIVQLYSL